MHTARSFDYDSDLKLENYLSLKSLHLISKKLPNISTLEFHGFESVRKAKQRQVTVLFPHITALNFTECSMFDNILQKTIESCPKLQKLTLENCNNLMYAFEKIIPKSALFTSQLSKITTLFLEDQNYLEPDSLKYLLKTCTLLTSLTIKNCDVAHFSRDDAFTHIAKYQRNLVYFETDNEQIKERDGLKIILQNMNNLQKLLCQIVSLHPNQFVN